MGEVLFGPAKFEGCPHYNELLADYEKLKTEVDGLRKDAYKWRQAEKQGHLIYTDRHWEEKYKEIQNENSQLKAQIKFALQKAMRDIGE